MNWIKRVEFDHIIRNVATPIVFNDLLVMRVGVVDLTSILGTDPEFIPVPEFEPSPYYCWFASINGHLGLLKAFPGDDEIAIFSIQCSPGVFPAWNELSDLHLDPRLVDSIAWVKGQPSASQSLVSNDEYGLEFELYRGKDSEDVKGLSELLRTCGFSGVLKICPAEDQEVDWVVEVDRRVIARYRSRYHSERMALERSKDNTAVYYVYSPSAAEQRLRFVNGQIDSETKR